MTTEQARPGLRLLKSLVTEERIGRPGAARDQALAAAQADAANAHVHLLDAAYAALVAGEPRAADQLLAQCEATAPGDDPWPRRIAATRAWSWSVGGSWYPGGFAAETLSFDVPQFPEARAGDSETILVEAIANAAHMLRVWRVRIEQDRENPEKAQASMGLAHENVQRLQSAVQGFAGESPALTVVLGFADLVHRAGKNDDADQVLAATRQDYELLAANGVANPVGQACTFLVEGDWYATPGSSPEALGFDLMWLSTPSPLLAQRDLGRAAAAYDRAEELLTGVDEPRAHGALALRRAALAWLSADHAAQQAFLAQAANAFAEAGDAAACWLTTAHTLLAGIALGHVAETRRLAGTGFDLKPRGPIADVLHWGEHDGSISWTTALGRLFQRAAERWDSDGDYERAAAAYELAAPLVPASGVESPAAVALKLAYLDRRNGFGVRALTRSRSAIAALPPVPAAAPDMPGWGPVDVFNWGRSLSALLDIVTGQLDAISTAAGMSVAVLDWAGQRIRELLALASVQAAGSGRDVTPETMPGGAADTAAEPGGEAAIGMPQLLAQVTMFAQVARQTIAFGDAEASFQRGNQASAIGASATANRWYDDALEKLAALPAESWPREVMNLAAQDRFDEARARLHELLDLPGQRPKRLALAAVSARDYDSALRLFGQDADTGRPWTDLLGHAEAALGAGQIQLALTLTDAAVRDFEERFGRLRRDVDRVAVSDNTQVARLYLVAARALLARAEQPGSDAGPEIKARAFELSDRARALALAALLADASDHTDDEQLILAWRRTTAEWQATYERLYRAYVTAAAEDEVAARVADLTSAEDALVAVEADLETKRTSAPRRAARREPPALEDIQQALPADTALIEYQLAGRDLLVWAITRTTADAAASQQPAGEIARLAKAVQRTCSNGRPGPEADELAAILLEPVASVAGACGRLIIVPYGRLQGLPFQVLPFGGRALGETHVLSYLPAAALLRGAAVDAPLAGRRALVVGDPAFDAATHPALRRLPGAAVEAATVAGTHQVPPLIGPEAAEPAIRRELARCDLVHLAAHGRLDPIAPSNSSIVLAGQDELTVADLVGMRIDSELAVLSACDSGRGAASLGGDVVGLARGLIAAGARRSIVSLWPVDDAPACVTMSLLHERLAQEVPVAAALHAAQNDVREMSGAEISARYIQLGGEANATALTRRRGAPSDQGAPELPLDPEFVDDLADADPVDSLSGELARVWAPFIVIGV
ncbi:MAG TPA: CHAT domain-containing protein [Thermoleophilaceae bacterium]|nr:CHAT domain-containing protein [Thermoleophilaceae bacterium]